MRERTKDFWQKSAKQIGNWGSDFSDQLEWLGFGEQFTRRHLFDIFFWLIKHNVSIMVDQEQIEILKRVLILDDEKRVEVGLAGLAFSMLFHNRSGIIRFMLHYQHYARTTIFVH